MKITINEYQFIEAFKNANREDNFTREGLIALYDYLTEVEEGSGQEMELDVIALCCEFTEYENIEELKKNHDNIEDMQDLEASTLVIPIDDESFIIQDF